MNPQTPAHWFGLVMLGFSVIGLWASIALLDSGYGSAVVTGFLALIVAMAGITVGETLSQ